MNETLLSKLKPAYQTEARKQEAMAAIPVFQNESFFHGDNEKYRKMYNWMAHVYDFGETLGKLRYGKVVNDFRRELVSKLEWENGKSVLYVSIGTGLDLKFVPDDVDFSSLDIVGVDISLGMLKKCQKSFRKHTNISLINCCAEELPFLDNCFDIVFHVGGINFFNDKQAAINEMIRVAKPGTKLLISDETQDHIDNQYNKVPVSKKYYENQIFDLSELEELIPSDAQEKKTELLWDNKFYAITFRKIS